jgi:phage terminase large subunit-like protein
VSRELDFICEEIVLPDGRKVGEALAPDPWIAEHVLSPVFEKDTKGRPRHRLCYFEMPRGHAKSLYAAAVATAESGLHGSTDVVIVAADKDQAAIVLDHLKGFLARNPSLAARFKVGKDELLIPSRGSRIRVIASDAPTAFGLGGTHKRFRVIADELTVWPVNGEALWIAMASATGKAKDVQTLILSNAGYSAGACWQWDVRETANRAKWAHFLTIDGPLASWISDEWIEQQRELLPPSAFERLILNRWVAESGDFVTHEQYRACVDRGREPSTAADPSVARYFAGVDLGLTHDRTALAIVHVDPVGHHEIILDELQVWQGTRDHPVEVAAVGRAVVEAKRRYPSLQIIADPWQFEATIQQLREAGITLSKFHFSTGIEKLSSILFQCISDASLRVFEDQELQQEVLGLQVQQTGGGWRIDHRSGAHDDRAIAIGMALTEAVKMRRGGGGAVGGRSGQIDTGLGPY